MLTFDYWPCYQVASQLLDLEIANSNLTIKNQNMKKEISALKSENAQLIQENMGRKCRHVPRHLLTTDDGAHRHVLDAAPLCENSQLLHMHACEQMSSVRAAANDEEQSPGTSGTSFSRPSSDSPQPPPRSPIRPFDAVVSTVLLREQGERGDSDTTLLVRTPEVAPASTPEDATPRSSSSTVCWRNSFQPEAFEVKRYLKTKYIARYLKTKYIARHVLIMCQNGLLPYISF
jgi:hypothetical protein